MTNPLNVSTPVAYPVRATGGMAGWINHNQGLTVIILTLILLIILVSVGMMFNRSKGSKP